MRNKSHSTMGRILLQEYLPDAPRARAKIFLLGCTQPDKNPATYLKGSLRSQWMRGHNYGNASRFMMRLAMRLDGKQSFSPWDYYCLGKLIHYTMDAFTYAHNEQFDTRLKEHREYEVQLQNYFLSQVDNCQAPSFRYCGSPAALIRWMHAAYARQPGSIETDTDYTFRTCCMLTQRLTAGLTPKHPAFA